MKNIVPFSRLDFYFSGSQKTFSTTGINSPRASAEPGANVWWVQFILAWTPKYFGKRVMDGGSNKPGASPLCRMKRERSEVLDAVARRAGLCAALVGAVFWGEKKP